MKLNPNKLKVRDPLMVRLICGATKSGVARDRKKDQNKYLARNRSATAQIED